MKEDQGMNSNDNTLTARDTSNGISKLPEMQLILPYKISCNRASSEIPLISLLTANFTAEVVYLFFIVTIILYKHHNKVHDRI